MMRACRQWWRAWSGSPSAWRPVCRATGGVKAAEVDIQLPVAEAVSDLVGPVHRQGGLADPGGPPDRAGSHRPPSPTRLVKQLGEDVQLLGAAGKMTDSRRK